jgi:hypothetical protein
VSTDYYVITILFLTESHPFPTLFYFQLSVSGASTGYFQKGSHMLQTRYLS